MEQTVEKPPHELLHALLKQGLRFHPHYPPSMNSDHLPMTLCAMKGLGASDDDLLRFRDGYVTKLREIDDAEPLADYRAGIGNMNMYPQVLETLREAIERSGSDEVVCEVAPQFLPGLATDAFHPLIRLGYGMAFDSDAEVAAALAYMVTVTMDLPISETSIDFEDMMSRQARAPLSMKGGRFNGGLAELVRRDEYPQGCATDFDTCARVSLDVYRSTRNFFALHMVTATQAARIVARVVDTDLCLAALTGALLAAHRIVGSPEFSRADPLPAPDRLDLEHAYKYAYACTVEYKEYSDPRYLEEVNAFKERGLVEDWVINPPLD